MSESIDNFKTLGQAVQVYTAHAMRLALVDAGDGMEDANFVHDTADKGILRLTKEPLWYDEVLAAELRSGEASSFADKVFDKQHVGLMACTKIWCTDTSRCKHCCWHLSAHTRMSMCGGASCMRRQCADGRLAPGPPTQHCPAGRCNVHARAHRSPEEGSRQCQGEANKPLLQLR
ncbi:hypothetical protein WJX77_004539 [Trebouxia sp. C0004]